LQSSIIPNNSDGDPNTVKLVVMGDKVSVGYVLDKIKDNQTSVHKFQCNHAEHQITNVRPGSGSFDKKELTLTAGPVQGVMDKDGVASSVLPDACRRCELKHTNQIEEAKDGTDRVEVECLPQEV
jgi:hypothetical protein